MSFLPFSFKTKRERLSDSEALSCFLFGVVDVGSFFFCEGCLDKFRDLSSKANVMGNNVT